MPTPLENILGRLRRSLSRQADDAYLRRDDPESSDSESKYAAGEADAFGQASDEVRDLENGGRDSDLAK